MSYPSLPKDVNQIPISSIYIPGVGFVALQGTNSSTDGSGNASAGVVAALYGKVTNPGDTPVLVDASGHVLIAQSDLTGSGTISAAQPVINTPVSNATVVLALGQGQSAWKAQLKDGGGGFTSGTTIVADKSIDGGTTYFTTSFKVTSASPATPQSSVVGPGPLELTGICAGATHIRIRCSVLNSTETIAVRINASQGVADVGLLSSIPAGTNKIGGVTLADGDAATIGAIADAAVTNPASSGSVVALLKGLLTRIGATFSFNAGTVDAGTLRVSLATDQKVPTKAASGDFADGSINTLGAQADAAYTDGTGAASGTSQGIFKGIFVKLASIVTNTNKLIAPSVNAGTIDATTQRTVAGGAGTGTKSNVASSASSVTILASNASRKGAVMYNDSTQILYLDLSGGTASNSSYSVQVPSQGFFELPGPNIYNGAITGIWAAANGNCRVTEWS